MYCSKWIILNINSKNFCYYWYVNDTVVILDILVACRLLYMKYIFNNEDLMFTFMNLQKEFIIKYYDD